MNPCENDVKMQLLVDPCNGSNSLVSVNNRQSNSKVFKGAMIGNDKFNPAFVRYLFVLQKCFPVFCNNLINCRLNCVSFIASITQIGF